MCVSISIHRYEISLVTGVITGVSGRGGSFGIGVGHLRSLHLHMAASVFPVRLTSWKLAPPDTIFTDVNDLRVR